MEIKSIPFNKPYLSGNETKYLNEAVQKGHISGNGDFTKKCHQFFEKKWGFHKCLLTTSCTDALEMCALLLDIKPGDEVIIPSFTFVSTALAFARQQAKIVFADSQENNPNIDTTKIEGLITAKTKAIVVVHYAGFACDMDEIKSIADKYKIAIIEDAAQAIDSYYKDKPLGSIGDLGCFSFHETKNVQCGEGGLLAINNKIFAERAEILWEKGTNRAQFFRGEINKYGWVDTGSSFLISDLLAAFLYAQLENIKAIQQRRSKIWNTYYQSLKTLEESGHIKLPAIPQFATNNAHMFYIVCANLKERTELIKHFRKHNILAVFHYQSLHKSQYIKERDLGTQSDLPNSDKFEERLIRLPLFYELKENEIQYILETIHSFYR